MKMKERHIILIVFEKYLLLLAKKYSHSKHMRDFHVHYFKLIIMKTFHQSALKNSSKTSTHILIF